MSTKCDNCGFKSNDVKSGGRTQELGCRLTLTVSEVLILFIIIEH